MFKFAIFWGLVEGTSWKSKTKTKKGKKKEEQKGRYIKERNKSREGKIKLNKSSKLAFYFHQNYHKSSCTVSQVLKGKIVK
jgi:hypothetical protein